MDQKVKDKIAAAEAKAEAAALKWLKENEPKIEQLVRATLNRKVDQVVLKLLGFDHRYESWQVDHCNGRAGDSAAGDWLRERAGAAVNTWLDEQAGKLPALPAKAVVSLRQSYYDALQHEVSRLLRDRAIEDAKAELLRVCAA